MITTHFLWQYLIHIQVSYSIDYRVWFEAIYSYEQAAMKALIKNGSTYLVAVIKLSTDNQPDPFLNGLIGHYAFDPLNSFVQVEANIFGSKHTLKESVAVLHVLQPVEYRFTLSDNSIKLLGQRVLPYEVLLKFYQLWAL